MSRILACFIPRMETIKVAVFCSIACATIGRNLAVESVGYQPVRNAAAESTKLRADLNEESQFANKVLFVLTKISEHGKTSTIVQTDPTDRDASPSNGSPKHANHAVKTTSLSEHPRKRLALTVTLVLVCLVAVFSCLVVTWLLRNRCLKRNAPLYSVQLHSESDLLEKRVLSLGPLIKRLNSLRIASKKKGIACALDFALLRDATNDFSSDNLLGAGGFGSVYRARFDDDFFAAVKQLDDKQEHVERDFQAEVELLSKVRHPNLVSLLGFSVHDNQHYLVYELLENGSLEDQLLGPSKGSALPWNLRMKIALDVARGLEHLHERCVPPVIHRDLKASNILLDANFNAKVSDFGLAIVCSRSAEELSVELQGTFGYLAPEYFLDGRLSEKSDVYAYGVVLLQLITGRKAIDRTMPIGRQALVTWAIPQLNDRSKVANLLDPSMEKESVDPKHLNQVAAIASLCIQSESSYRPLIVDVVNSLVPLIPVELGGALKRVGGRCTEQPFLETAFKSFSFSDYNSRTDDRYDHLRSSVSARMAIDV